MNPIHWVPEHNHIIQSTRVHAANTEPKISRFYTAPKIADPQRVIWEQLMHAEGQRMAGKYQSIQDVVIKEYGYVFSQGPMVFNPTGDCAGKSYIYARDIQGKNIAGFYTWMIENNKQLHPLEFTE